MYQSVLALGDSAPALILFILARSATFIQFPSFAAAMAHTFISSGFWCRQKERKKEKQRVGKFSIL
jgi:hypothetical protein